MGGWGKVGEDPPPSRIWTSPVGGGQGVSADCGGVDLPTLQTLDLLSQLLEQPPALPSPTPARCSRRPWNQMSHSSIWGQFCCSRFSPVP